MQTDAKPWFWRSVAYEIYPRSFYDSNGDGIGDLKGITAKLDYLSDLGIGVIWLCPFFTSPMADFGYDIADYLSVDPSFGTLEDFKDLVAKAHERGIRVLIDLVANHTSDEHSWFKESRSSRKNAKRDWYIWREPHDSGAPPNNWRSAFGGSAWEYDSLSSQYYLHSFSIKQPDLNWANPEVREAIKSVVNFWLSLGVDGFRADAVYWWAKDQQLRDDPPSSEGSIYTNFDYSGLSHQNSKFGPQLYEYLKEITDGFGYYGGRFMVFEAFPEAPDKVSEYLKFYQQVDPRRGSPFLLEVLHQADDIMSLKSFIDRFQAAAKPDYLPVYTLGNHDEHRLASRIDRHALRNMAMMLLSLPGMPFIYYGEEIGMTDIVLPPGQQKDLMPGNQARDGGRSPMQWNDDRNAGFSSGVPWMPLPDSYGQVNVIDELSDRTSLLSLYRDLIKFRNNSPVLQFGSYHPLNLANKVFGYIRQYGQQRIVVIMNFNDTATKVPLGPLKGKIVISTQLDHQAQQLTENFELGANQGVIIALD